MAFTIYNDPSAGVNAAPLSVTQARPDKVDIDIISAALRNCGVFADAAGTTNGCAVTPFNSGVSLNVSVAAGTAVFNGTTGIAVAAQTNLTVTAADATNPRRDLVVVNTSGTASVVAGTAAAIPDLPSIPANSVVLAKLDVPSGATSITTSNIVDSRFILPIVPFAVQTKTANYTMLLTDALVLANAASGAITVTLPPAVADLTVAVKKIDAQASYAVTVQAQSAATIDGQATVSTTVQYQSYTFTSDGTNWFLT